MAAGHFVATGAMVAISCGKCGIEFHVPERWDRERRAKRDTWYCPNGHGRAYLGQTEAERLRLEADALKQQLERKQRQIEDERRARVSVEHRLRAARGQQTRLKRRIAAGVCPCCNRTFQNLARHVAHQHPEFAGEVPS